MTESIKRYILLGVLVSCLGLVLYAMPESPALNDGMSAGLQLSGNMTH